MIADLNDYSLWVIFPICVTVILGASEVGRWLGGRAALRGADSVSTLEGAMLGLLALMIGFTFAMVLSRFEARRDAVLAEANAIGTTALRARLLPAPHNGEVVKLLREYVQLRLDITRRLPTAQEFGAMISRSNAIQESLWQQAKAVAAKDNSMVPTGVFIQSLNKMIDDQETRLAALHNRLPMIVLIALYGVATIAIGFTGYASRLQARHSRLAVYITGVLVASMVLLIQDIDRPGAGFIKVSQQPMINAAASLATYSD
ncbi:MAG: hypothetical protein FD144_5819 [Rhodospirillaceae bacterium]|nr:MAG: hypothetical protein FD144_5819 [Rhodospirillaceae bacterium]